VTPRIVIAGHDPQQRQWLRHHLQSLWPDADPAAVEPAQLAHQLNSTAPRRHDAILLCVRCDAGEGDEGLEDLRLLRHHRHHLPIIVIATQGNELTAIRAIRLGAAAYLPRDLLDAQRLAAAVRKALHASRRRRQRGSRQRRRPSGPGRAAATRAGPSNAPTLPGFTLLRELGNSARASVWLARSVALERAVALKISTPTATPSSDPGHVEGQQFAREYAAIAALRTPAVVDIFDYGLHDGREYLAMEYFPCGDLKQRLLHPIRSEEALAFARRIAAALCVTHAAGIVHRDLKPPNIMLRPDGSVALIDFGIAKQLDSNTNSTAIGVLRGSPYYMSPEQVQGLVLDGRSDIYSLGVILFEMLTGHKPFHGLTAMELMQKHVSGERPALPDALTQFEPLLAQLMARERDARCVDAPTALAALEAAHAA